MGKRHSNWTTGRKAAETKSFTKQKMRKNAVNTLLLASQLKQSLREVVDDDVDSDDDKNDDSLSFPCLLAVLLSFRIEVRGFQRTSSRFCEERENQVAIVFPELARLYKREVLLIRWWRCVTISIFLNGTNLKLQRLKFVASSVTERTFETDVVPRRNTWKTQHVEFSNQRHTFFLLIF